MQDVAQFLPFFVAEMLTDYEKRVLIVSVTHARESLMGLK
jgi:hypothetical protein